MWLVDAGVLTLDTPFTYSTPNPKDEPRALRDWLDPMVTVSDNQAAHALLQGRHRYAPIEALGREFRELGLGTLQVNGTRAADGYGWQTEASRRTAFDTARRLGLIEGPAGELWRPPEGRPVTANLLSQAARTYLTQLLLEHRRNEA